MNRSLVRECLIGLISRQIIVTGSAPPPLVAQAPSVGFTDQNGNQRWYDQAEALGSALADDAGFRAIELGTWLRSPDGEFISEAVGQVLPPTYRPEYQLVVDARTFAAAKQHEEGLQRALGIGVVAGVSALLLWGLGGN